ncbi:membrane metallo-endopeptidase-like 1 [Xylocopa sonorina]|uniref:membrane metallo-endopeptidase-like 1 n=1 Tax=Xylocopa sonorina TaxID=1818115 RepID=UPI00403AA999
MLLEILLFCFAIFVDGHVIAVERNERSICLTEGCKEFARRILTNMNATADPCVDFYEYACGNLARTHILLTGWNPGQIRMASAIENKRTVREMLKQDSRHDEIFPVKIAKQWYNVCMDTEAMERQGVEPLVSMLNDIGGWPILMELDEWNGTEQRWQDIDDYYSHLSGSNLFHDVRVTIYGANSTEITAVLDVPNMPPYSWMTEVFFNETDKNHVRAVEKHWDFAMKIILTMAEAVRFNLTTDQLEKDVEDLLNFEWKLSKITSLLDDYVNMTVGGFQRWYDSLGPRTKNAKVNWAEKIIAIFRESNVDISEDTIIKVTSPNYFKDLVLLLDESPSRTIVNYLHWSFVSSTIMRTTNEMRELFASMDDDAVPGEEVRSDLCIAEAKMEDVVAYEYARRHFSSDTKRMALLALDDMEKEMEIDIENSNWPNEEIKDTALKRIRSVKRYIGYPEWYNNATVMANYFHGLEMGPTYIENALKFQRYYKLKELQSLKNEDAEKPWIVDPLTINAFYLSKSNSITVPLANLQKPLFSTAQPNTMNYALTGFLLAHELYHAFDELRRLYNERGEAINWPETMTKEYYKSAQCFVRQYNNYTLDGTPSGPRVENYGNQTFDENMSDTMGVRTAFKAYKRREIINGKPDSALPGLETFSNDQLFFLSFANLWCTRDKSDEIDRLIIEAKLYQHSIARLRSIGSLSNNQDFADAYSCPLGSPMNPQKKCNIWKV